MTQCGKMCVHPNAIAINMPSLQDGISFGFFIYRHIVPDGTEIHFIYTSADPSK